MNVGPPLVADPQPAELVQPGQGSLHYPPIDTQPPPCWVNRWARTGPIPNNHSALP
jgi:hypothetical protein